MQNDLPADAELLEVVKLIVKSSYTVILTGAGVSTESGIPDFRGVNGIWTKDKELEEYAYHLYELFLKNPKTYWEAILDSDSRYGKFYKILRNAKPNKAHFIMSSMEKEGFVKSVITQNVDGLHRKAGSKNVIEYHGSIDKLKCINCGAKYFWNEVNFDKLPPLCRCGNALKDDVVHFTEPIDEDIIENSINEMRKAELVFVCGTSTVVYPFAALPRIAKYKKRPAVVVEINLSKTVLTEDGISDFLLCGMVGTVLSDIYKQLKKISNYHQLKDTSINS